MKKFFELYGIEQKTYINKLSYDIPATRVYLGYPEITADKILKLEEFIWDYTQSCIFEIYRKYSINGVHYYNAFIEEPQSILIDDIKKHWFKTRSEALCEGLLVRHYNIFTPEERKQIKEIAENG